jgi:hypothetical protein
MKRVLTAVLVAAGLGLSGARAEAQVRVYFGGSSDSAVAVLTGGATGVQVSVSNQVDNYSGCYYSPYYFYDSYCLTYAQLTFVYDPALIDSIGVEPSASGFATLSGTSPASGRFTVTASGGVHGYEAPLFRLRIRLAAGAHDGGYIWAQVDSLASPGYTNIAAVQGGARVSAAQVCHATSLYGDVDGNGGVDSRDALITLSAAVGLPVSGFSLGLGDVDDDGLTNSRDALMMLSYAIALPISSTNRVGVAIPDACPGLTAPGETVVFQRALASGGGLFRLDSLSTVPVQITTDASDAWPRLNAAGTTVAFQCYDPSYLQVCSVALAGADRRVVTGPGVPIRMAPDWSPTGTKLAYLQQYGGPPTLYTMDSSGVNQFPVAGLQSGAVAWSHGGDRLAFLDWYTNLVRTVTMDTAHTVETPSAGATGVGLVRWSPLDTVVAYQPVFYGPLWSVPPTSGGTPTRLVAISGIQEFDWSAAGIVFSMAMGYQPPSLWMLRGGPSGTLVRLTAPGVSDSDHQPSLRRAP